MIVSLYLTESSRNINKPTVISLPLAKMSTVLELIKKLSVMEIGMGEYSIDSTTYGSQLRQRGFLEGAKILGNCSIISLIAGM